MVVWTTLARPFFERKAPYLRTKHRPLDPSLFEPDKKERDSSSSYTETVVPHSCDDDSDLGSGSGERHHDHDRSFEDDDEEDSLYDAMHASSCMNGFSCFPAGTGGLEDSCRVYHRRQQDWIRKKKHNISPRLCRAKGWEETSRATVDLSTHHIHNCNRNSNPNKRKHVHFAQVAVVHEIPRNDELDDYEDEEEVNNHNVLESSPSSSFLMDPIRRYWWTEDECNRNRSDVCRSVQYYRTHEFEFVQGISVLANPQSSEEQVDDELEELALMHSSTRGMESHICDVLSSPRKVVLRAVLEQQQEMIREGCRSDDKDSQDGGATREKHALRRLNSDHSSHASSSSSTSSSYSSGADATDSDKVHDMWLERIKVASMTASLSNRTYATRMGKYDASVALNKR